jgi:hypothetical protein
MEVKTHVDRSEDNIYYNIRITSETNGELAQYSENRVSPIIQEPSKYKLAVERFRIPAVNIPIMRWKPDFFKVTMSYAGTDITETLQFIPNSTDPDFYGDAIWNYQEFIDIVNKALSDAFTTIKGIHAGAPPTEAPFLTYEADTQLFTFNAEQLYDTTGPATINIYFNPELYLLFPSFPTFADHTGSPEKEYQIIVKNNFNNSTTINAKAYYSTKQEYTTLFLFNDLVSIAFETDSIPVTNEKEGDQRNVVKRLITDFEPLEDINNRQAFQYFPQGPLRYYDMNSVYPLSRIDLRVRWVDKNNESYPIYINKNEALTVKILFKKVE